MVSDGERASAVQTCSISVGSQCIESNLQENIFLTNNGTNERFFHDVIVFVVDNSI